MWHVDFYLAVFVPFFFFLNSVCLGVVHVCKRNVTAHKKTVAAAAAASVIVSSHNTHAEAPCASPHAVATSHSSHHQTNLYAIVSPLLRIHVFTLCHGNVCICSRRRRRTRCGFRKCTEYFVFLLLFCLFFFSLLLLKWDSNSGRKTATDRRNFSFWLKMPIYRFKFIIFVFCSTARQATGQHWAVSNSCMYYSAQLLLLIIRRSWSELSDLLINIFISLLLGEPI